MRIQILILGFKGLNAPFLLFYFIFFLVTVTIYLEKLRPIKLIKQNNKQTESKTSGSHSKCQLFSKAKTVLRAVLNSVSPNVHDVRESRQSWTLDSTSWIPDSNYWISDLFQDSTDSSC